MTVRGFEVQHFYRLWRYFAVVIVAVMLGACANPEYVVKESNNSDLHPENVVNVGPEDFPNHGAVILVRQRIHKWSFWNPSEIKEISRVKILNEEGIEDFGNFVSEPIYKKAKYKLQASVTSPTGDEKNIGGDNKKKVLIGDNFFEYRIAFPGLEVGSIIEIEEESSGRPIKSGYWNFASHVPTLRSQLAFVVPRGVKVDFNFTPQESGRVPKPLSTDKFDSYIITKEVVPPYDDEIYMPMNHVGNPSLYYYVWKYDQADVGKYLLGDDYDVRAANYMARYVEEHDIDWSFFSEWNDVGNLFAKYFDPYRWRNADDADKYRSRADEIVLEMDVESREDPGQALDTILVMFHKRFSPLKIGSYAAFYGNPEESFDTGEGGPFELAYALRYLLDKLDVISTVVVVRDVDRGFLDKRNPDESALHHPLLLVQTGEAEYWIDPFSPGSGANQLPWKCQGVKGLWLKTDKDFSFVTTPLDNEYKNCFTDREEVTIAENGDVAGRATYTLTGQFLLGLRQETGIGDMDPTDERLIAFVERNVSDAFDTDGIEIDIDSRDTLQVSFDYMAAGFADRSGEYLNIDFSPWCRCPVQKVFENDERKFDVVFPYPATRNTTVKIKIPEDFEIAEAAENTDQTNKSFAYRKMCYRQGNGVVLSRYFAITSPTVDAADYLEAKEFVAMTRKYDAEAVVLRRSQ